MQIVGIIPSRYDSTRFPGKPLLDLGGKTMIQRVYGQSSKALEWVYVATDDERIYNNVLSFGGNVIMTSKDHKTGTDRCSEAIKIIHEINKDLHFDVVINIQGDEPFIKPEQIRILMSCFDNKSIQIATLAKHITVKEEIFSPNIVKLIRNNNSQAIYFSRSVIPFIRNENPENWHKVYSFLKHIGIYAFRTSVLKELTLLSSTPTELAESLEQNRWIENGYSIHVEITEFETMAIDTPQDIEKVKHFFN